jgi:hypothetical protein
MDDQTLTDADWKLLEHLKDKPHPLIREIPLPDDPFGGIGEILQSVKVAHHLLDLAGVPRGKIYSAYLDSRVLLLARQAHRLQRLADMHQPDRNCDGCGGNSGYCVECELPWPCASAQVASGEQDDML